VTPTRRRWIALVTLLIGTGALIGLLRVDADDPRFALAAACVAAIWFGGGWLAGPPPVRGDVGARRAAGLGVGSGLLAAAVCLSAGFVAAHVAGLRDPAQDLLAHTATGTVAVFGVALLNGIAEELFFRGALYDALSPPYALLGSTGAYVLTTVGSGVLLLPAAALLLGLLTGWLRRVTGGVIAPAAAHLTWSLAMISVLPSVLSTGR
jgi:uncharacterized protein